MFFSYNHIHICVLNYNVKYISYHGSWSKLEKHCVRLILLNTAFNMLFPSFDSYLRITIAIKHFFAPSSLAHCRVCLILHHLTVPVGEATTFSNPISTMTTVTCQKEQDTIYGWRLSWVERGCYSSSADPSMSPLPG